MLAKTPPFSMDKPRGPRVEFANTLRGFAAISVMISHYLAFFGPGREQMALIICMPPLPLENHPVPLGSQWLLSCPFFSPAPFGVALFFIISGFVIPFSLQKLSGWGFAVNRLFRILPTYIVGFSITVAALYFGTKYFSVAWPYSLKEVLIHYIPGIRDLLWSRHIDFIVWTLEIEVKFYFICAVFSVWLRRCSLKAFGVPVTLFVMALFLNPMIPIWEHANVSLYRLALIYVTSSQYLIFMFIGVAFHYLHREKIKWMNASILIAGMYALFCISGWMGPYAWGQGIAGSYVIALLAFGFGYAFKKRFTTNRVFEFLAAISYPLYIIHAVPGYIALRILSQRGVSPWIAMLLVFPCCLFCVWLLHALVERPSQVFSKKLGARLPLTLNDHTRMQLPGEPKNKVAKVEAACYIDPEVKANHKMNRRTLS